MGRKEKAVTATTRATNSRFTRNTKADQSSAVQLETKKGKISKTNIKQQDISVTESSSSDNSNESNGNNKNTEIFIKTSQKPVIPKIAATKKAPQKEMKQIKPEDIKSTISVQQHIQSDINQRPRRQIKHKYIKSMRNIDEQKQPLVEEKLEAVQNENPINEVISKQSEAISIIDESSNSSRKSTVKTAEPARLRRSGRQNRFNEVEEQPIVNEREEENQSSDENVLQIIEIIDANQQDVIEEIIETCTNDSDQYELMYVEEAPHSRDVEEIPLTQNVADNMNKPTDDSLSSSDGNVELVCNAQNPDNDTYLVNAEDSCSNSQYSEDSACGKQIYVEVTESLDSQEIVEMEVTYDSNSDTSNVEYEIIEKCQSQEAIITFTEEQLNNEVVVNEMTPLANTSKHSFEGAFFSNTRKSKRINKIESVLETPKISEIANKTDDNKKALEPSDADVAVSQLNKLGIFVANSTSDTSESEPPMSDIDLQSKIDFKLKLEKKKDSETVESVKHELNEEQNIEKKIKKLVTLPPMKRLTRLSSVAMRISEEKPNDDVKKPIDRRTKQSKHSSNLNSNHESELSQKTQQLYNDFDLSKDTSSSSDNNSVNETIVNDVNCLIKSKQRKKKLETMHDVQLIEETNTNPDSFNKPYVKKSKSRDKKTTKTLPDSEMYRETEEFYDKKPDDTLINMGTDDKSGQNERRSRSRRNINKNTNIDYVSSDSSSSTHIISSSAPKSTAKETLRDIGSDIGIEKQDDIIDGNIENVDIKNVNIRKEIEIGEVSEKTNKSDNDMAQGMISQEIDCKSSLENSTTSSVYNNSLNIESPVTAENVEKIEIAADSDSDTMFTVTLLKKNSPHKTYSKRSTSRPNSLDKVNILDQSLSTELAKPVDTVQSEESTQEKDKFDNIDLITLPSDLNIAPTLCTYTAKSDILPEEVCDTAETMDTNKVENNSSQEQKLIKDFSSDSTDQEKTPDKLVKDDFVSDMSLDNTRQDNTPEEFKDLPSDMCFDNDKSPEKNLKEDLVSDKCLDNTPEKNIKGNLPAGKCLQIDKSPICVNQISTEVPPLLETTKINDNKSTELKTEPNISSKKTKSNIELNKTKPKKERTNKKNKKVIEFNEPKALAVNKTVKSSPKQSSDIQSIKKNDIISGDNVTANAADDNAKLIDKPVELNICDTSSNKKTQLSTNEKVSADSKKKKSPKDTNPNNEKKSIDKFFGNIKSTPTTKKVEITSINPTQADLDLTTEQKLALNLLRQIEENTKPRRKAVNNKTQITELSPVSTEIPLKSQEQTSDKKMKESKQLKDKSKRKLSSGIDSDSDYKIKHKEDPKKSKLKQKKSPLKLLEQEQRGNRKNTPDSSENYILNVIEKTPSNILIENKQKLQKVKRSRWSNALTNESDSDLMSDKQTNIADNYSILSECYLPKMVKYDESLYSIEALKAAEARDAAEREAISKEIAKKEAAAKEAAKREAAAKEVAKKEAATKEAAKKEAAAKDAAKKEAAAKEAAKKEAAAMDVTAKDAKDAAAAKLVSSHVDTYGLCASKTLYSQLDSSYMSTVNTNDKSPLNESYYLTDYKTLMGMTQYSDSNPEIIQSPDQKPKKIYDRRQSEIKSSKDRDIKRDSHTDSSPPQNEEETNIRRSGRIKTKIETNQRSHGYGLVRDKDRYTSMYAGSCDSSYSSLLSISQDTTQYGLSDNSNASILDANEMEKYAALFTQPRVKTADEIEIEQTHKVEGLSLFTHIVENEYKSDRNISKEGKKMTCDCFLTKSEKDRGELGCGEDCLNRLLMIECGLRCAIGDRCTNKRFQKIQNADCTIFKTDKKGFGMKASSFIPAGEFIMEYVGEVLSGKQFGERAEEYSKDKNKHYYFMALRGDCVIDATSRGNISRFINHSCDPNAETQKWTVNGELRIGFFSTKNIYPDQEITFDYQFQRYGKEAQKCYCEAELCRGWIGEEPESDEDDEDLEEEEEEEEEMEVEEEEGKGKELVAETLTAEVKTDVESAYSLSEPTVVTDIPVEGEFIEKLPTEVIPESVDNEKPVKTEDEPPRRKIVKVKKEKPISNELKLYKKHKSMRTEITEDPDLYNEISILTKSNLKNQAHTLRFSRLMVRAKQQEAKSQLLYILRNGELVCRRLFLDYHGLKLLYAWMCDTVRTDMTVEWEFRLEILETLEVLPIPNKTMLQDSKVLVTVRKWANTINIKESVKSPDESQSDSGSGTPVSDEVVSPKVDDSKIEELRNISQNIQSNTVTQPPEVDDTSNTNEKKTIDSSKFEKSSHTDSQEIIEQIRFLASKLVAAWDQLPEVFRIPKKLRIEQMKEHEREANLSYQALGLTEEKDNRTKRYKEKFRDRDKDRFRDKDRSRYKDSKDSESYLSKLQRRQLFEAKVALETAEKQKSEDDIVHAAKCTFFRLDPRTVSKTDMPFSVNPVTGQWYTEANKMATTPPSHAHIKPPPQLKSTNPDDYDLPPMDLPDFWKFAIDTLGRTYYYHVKIRIPQWEPPIKLLPLMEEQKPIDERDKIESDIDEHEMIDDEDVKDGLGGNIVQESESDDNEDNVESSGCSTDTNDSSEEELETKLQQIKSNINAKKSDLDNMLRKPPNLAEEISALATTSDSAKSDLSWSEPAEHKDISLNLDYSVECVLSNKKKKRRDGLVQERIISPRTEEERLQIKLEMRRYKENKEKLRRRKEEAKRKKIEPLSRKLTKLTEGLPVLSQDDDLHTDDDDDEDDTNPNASIIETSTLEALEQDIETAKSSPLICNVSMGTKIVDELDALKRKEKVPSKKIKLEIQRVKPESKLIQKTNKRRKTAPDIPINHGNSEAAKRIKDKFRAEIAGVIVHHLGPYRKESCKIGRITNNDDFKHLAKKLTHFVMLKELKHCDNTINVLEVTDSVKQKSKEFIRKYMAKFGEVYEKPENEPEYRDFNNP